MTQFCPRLVIHIAAVHCQMLPEKETVPSDKVMAELRAWGLTMDAVEKVDEAELSQRLSTVGFYRMKARYLKRTTAELRNRFGGRVPGD